MELPNVVRNARARRCFAHKLRHARRILFVGFCLDCNVSKQVDVFLGVACHFARFD